MKQIVKSQKAMAPPAVSATEYKGSYTLKSKNAGNDLAVFQFNTGAALTTSAAGVLATVFDPVSQITSSPNWSNISGNYTEWRILSGHLHYEPVNKYNQPTTNVINNVYTVIDRNSATALSSTSVALGYTDCEIHNLQEPFDMKWKMSGIGEATWVSTSSTPAAADRVYAKFYSSGNSNSINVGEYLYVYLVEFKNQQ